MKKTIIACILSLMLGGGIVALVFLPDRADPVPIAETEDERLDRLFRQFYEESKEYSYQHWKETQSFDFEEVDFKTRSCSHVSLTAYGVAFSYFISDKTLREQIEEHSELSQKYDESFFDLLYEIILDVYDSFEPTGIFAIDSAASDKFARKWEVRCLRAFRED